MRSSIVLLLLTLFLTSACHPVLPPESLAADQSMASAIKSATAETGFVVLYPELQEVL